MARPRWGREEEKHSIVKSGGDALKNGFRNRPASKPVPEKGRERVKNKIWKWKSRVGKQGGEGKRPGTLLTSIFNAPAHFHYFQLQCR